MKLFARQAIAASLFCAVASVSTAFAQQPFTSRNEPLTPAMASRGEMDAFRTDLDVYVKNIDREIEKLLIFMTTGVMEMIAGIRNGRKKIGIKPMNNV